MEAEDCSVSIPWMRLPFRFETPADYSRHLSAWIGQAFYEVLPAAGYQVREEQIYFAFRVAAALEGGRPILAEAGAGTGKTFGYLLPAICHARLSGRPVVVATATPALEAQLAGRDGDVATLSRLLGLEVDARVARRPEGVVCDIRVERLAGSGRRVPGRAGLLRWVAGSALGARAEFPAAPDDVWAKVAWDAGCRCDVCPRRGYCRLTRGREAARAAADLVVCSHDLFFEDTFSRDRLPPGRLPVLPPFSGVVFDEGHRVALAAQRAAGSRLRPGEVHQAIDGCEGQGVRARLLRLAEAARTITTRFLGALEGAVAPADELRRPVGLTPTLLSAAVLLDRALGQLQDEMAIEEGLHQETAYAARLEAFHTWLDAAQAACRGLSDPTQVPWLEAGDLWVAPRDLGPLWRRYLPERSPLVFSSATLSATGTFEYAARTLGLREPLTAKVGVPFRLASQVLCYLPRDLPAGDALDFWPKAAERIARLLEATGGRALILLPDAAAQRALKGHLRTTCTVRWEGDAGPEALLASFARDVASCLVGSGFWEGVDVPGEALSAVVIPVLPLPGADPVLQARRDAVAATGAEPFAAVDVPDMALRLRQGIGRLIRTENDRGLVAILDGRAALDAALARATEAALPDGARRVRTMGPVARFFTAGTPAPAAAVTSPRSRDKRAY